MRLLKFATQGRLSCTKNLRGNVPPYAILSHTWGADEDEVTLEDLKQSSFITKTGYAKIQFCGEQAKRDNLEYFWVDTCCIDKANHTELAEAIASMFRWYRQSEKCYVYLADLSTNGNQKNETIARDKWEFAFRKSRWFTRGWTLPELLAPKVVEFYSQEGNLLGDKRNLAQLIHEITGIPVAALQGTSLSQFSVDERLRWPAQRDTGRKEDKAYSLMGIFNVFIPLIYGEGENAFVRLKEEIDRHLRRADGEAAPSANQVNMHESFDDWLPTFASDEQCGGKSDEEQQLEVFRKQKRNDTFIPSTKSKLQSDSGTQPNKRAGPIASCQHTSSRGSEILSNDSVRLVICDLEKPGSDALFVEEITTTPNTPLYEVIFDLVQKGYHRICGFQDQTEDLVFAPISPYDSPLYVNVTTEESCYDIAAGLKINQHQTLLAYYNQFLRYWADPQSPESLSIQYDSTKISYKDRARGLIANISFHRTLRVPEDGKTYDLPSTSGTFRLLNTKDFAEKLPEWMRKKDGLFFPMFQREAMSIHFEALISESHNSYTQTKMGSFAVKVYAGSVNCVSGRAVQDGQLGDDQDYVVCPNQIRLDGFKSSRGEVKQFTAMPLGWKYSIEQQVTGSEFIGGIQLQIAPRLSDSVEFCFLPGNGEEVIKMDLVKSPFETGRRVGQILSMTDFSGVLKHGKIRASQTIGADPKLFPMNEDKCRPVFVGEVIQRAISRMNPRQKFVLKPVRPLTLRIHWDSMLTTGQASIQEYSPFLDISIFKDQIYQTYKACGQLQIFGYLHFNGTRHEGYPLEYVPLSSVAPMNAYVHFVADPRAAPADTIEYRGDADETEQPLPGWEMAFGTGGKLREHIHQTRDKHLWDWENSRLVNIQILNSVAFKSVTSVPPWSPITLRDYLRARVPFHSFIPEEGRVEPDCPEITLKSVGELDLERYGEAKIGLYLRKERRPMGCANCEVNFCDTVLRPCNHTWCSDCIAADMRKGGQTTCAYCSKVASDSVQFSAPTEIPFKNALTAMPVVDHDEKQAQQSDTERELKFLYETYNAIISVPFQTKKSGVVTLADITNLVHFHCIYPDPRQEFDALASLLKKVTPAVRFAVARSLLLKILDGSEASEMYYFIARLLAFFSTAEELGDGNEVNLTLLIRKARRHDTYFLPILDWLMTVPISPSNLGCPIQELLKVKSSTTLDRVLHYLTSGGQSLRTDYNLKMHDIVGAPMGGVRLARKLVMSGSDINELDLHGRTVLWYLRDWDSFNDYLEIGARVDIIDTSGNLLIHFAILEHLTFLLDALLDSDAGKATMNLRNRDYHTAYHLSLNSKVVRLRQKLEEVGADITIPIPEGRLRESLEQRLSNGDARGEWASAIRLALANSADASCGKGSVEK